MPSPIGARITTRFTAQMHQEIMAWGAARGITEQSAVMRALCADALEGEKRVEARAWRAAYEAAMAELRSNSREALARAAEELRQGVSRLRR